MNDSDVEIDIAGEYGLNDGTIHILVNGQEVVMWDSVEWIEDPSLVFVIANAIRQAHEGKLMLGKGMTANDTPHVAKIVDGVLTCPVCDRQDIREWDRAERWNRTELRGDVLFVSQGQSDFETMDYICADCQATMDLPEGIEVEWT